MRDLPLEPEGGRTTGSALLDAHALERRSDGRVLLDRVSIAIDRGDRIAVVGPTGCGKTVLLRALAQLDPIDGGSIHFQGRTWSGRDLPVYRSRVAYVAQRPALTEGTVEEILADPFALRVHHARSFDRDRILGMLEHIGRGAGFLAQSQRDLSGGESQIVALIRALQLDPELLLLDEPTSALDNRSCELVERLVDDWMDADGASRACVWITHDPDQARRVAHTVRPMRDGRWEETADAGLR